MLLIRSKVTKAKINILVSKYLIGKIWHIIVDYCSHLPNKCILKSCFYLINAFWNHFCARCTMFVRVATNENHLSFTLFLTGISLVHKPLLHCQGYTFYLILLPAVLVFFYGNLSLWATVQTPSLQKHLLIPVVDGCCHDFFALFFLPWWFSIPKSNVTLKESCLPK